MENTRDFSQSQRTREKNPRPATISLSRGKQRCKQNALRRAKQSDEKGQSDAIAATIVKHKIIYILAFFLAFTFKITETSVKVLPSLNVKHLQQAVGTHLILPRQISKDTMMCICIYMHATAQAGENIK